MQHSKFLWCMLLMGSTALPLSAQDLPVMDGLEVWLDATDPETLFADDFFTEPAEVGDPIGGWKDKSENGYEVWGVYGGEFADEPRFPTWAPEAMNGRPALRFTAANAEGMIFEDDFALEREYTAFIVNQYWGDRRGRTLQSTEINWLMGLWAGNTGHFAEGWVSSVDRAQNDFAYLGEAIGGADSSAFFVNGQDVTANPGPVGVPGRLGIVGGWGSGGFPNELSDADVSEIILYNRVLEDGERDSVRQYLTEKYDLGDGPPPPPAREMTVHLGSVGFYTGGDPGEGLDFEGDFAYAINVGGKDESPDFEPLVVGDAEFTDGSEALGTDGVFITDANQIDPWGAKPEFGDTANDDALEVVSNSIRWNVAQESALEINMEVDEGQAYRLQLLFHEQCCDRGWDITIEDALAVDNYNPSKGGINPETGEEYVLQDGIGDPSRGAFFAHEFVAGDDELNLVFGGSDPVAPDNNPILDGITLERIELSLIGDCNGDGVVNAEDLACVSTIEERDAVLESIPSLPGDFDGDGNVAFGDFLVLSNGFGQSEGTYVQGNIDLEGGIEFADFLILSSNFGQSPAASVPEPSGWLLLLGGLIGLMRRRKR